MADTMNPVDYTTCFGCHVRTFAKLLGYFMIILALLSLTIAEENPFFIVFNIIYLICGVFLILADKYENPHYYLPFLIHESICLVYDIMMFVFAVIYRITTAKSNIDVGTVFAAVISCYFWYVVKRAREYMENEICARKIPLSANGYVHVCKVLNQEKAACCIEMDTCFKKCQLKCQVATAEWEKIKDMYNAECSVIKDDLDDLARAQSDFLDELKNLVRRQDRLKQMMKKKTELEGQINALDKQKMA